jgi:ABC-type dipeptide/oligopeptide/nickel transport system permease component
LNSFAHLRFGDSAISGTPIETELAARLPVTLGLVLEGIVAAMMIGVPVGFLFGTGPARLVAAPLIQIVSAAPIFCAGLALAYLAVNFLHWPVQIDGPAPFGSAVFPRNMAEAQEALLSALTVGLAGASAVQVAMSRTAAEIAHEPWRTQLFRMGLSRWDIEWIYVVPQIFAAIFAHLGDVMLALLSATAVAEWVFSCPGAADLFVKSVALRDWSAAGAIMTVFAGLTLIAGFLGRCAAQPLINRGAAR